MTKKKDFKVFRGKSKGVFHGSKEPTCWEQLTRSKKKRNRLF